MKYFICPCCNTKHPLKWARQRMLSIQSMPLLLRSYGEIAFYKSAQLQHIDDENDDYIKEA